MGKQRQVGVLMFNYNADEDYVEITEIKNSVETVKRYGVGRAFSYLLFIQGYLRDVKPRWLFVHDNYLVLDSEALNKSLDPDIERVC